MFIKIKHFLSISCFVLFMLSFPTFNMSAQTYYDYYGGVYYQPNNDGCTAAIASPNGDGYYQGNINIPETITNEDNGVTYTVTSILGRAFENSPNLLRVAIPKTVQEIGAWAFHNCPKLKTIELKGGIATIGNDVFANTEIQTLILGPHVTSIKNLKLDPSLINSEAIHPPVCDENTFTGYDADLNVPDEGYDEYLTADYWKNFFVCNSITLDIESITLPAGETFTLVATVDCHNIKNPIITWTSSNESIATVDENGVITAVAVGECDITATCQGMSVSCHVRVRPILPTSISISAEDESLFVGETLQLVATVLPENTTDKTVTWSSSNAVIATVDANGLVTAVAVGECDITALCQNVLATCHITVKPILPEAIILNATEQSIILGETFQLRATVMPENTTDKTVTWSSSDENIATVDKHGLVTALAFGECEITASCQDVAATCHITVSPIPVESITLNATQQSVIIGETFQLTATVLPENATYKTVTWASSNESIATVDQNGLVTALSLGECNITATCQGITATCHITVVPVQAGSVTLNVTEQSLFIGDTFQLTATVLPENATNKTVIWSSSNQSIATVDQNGLVTALAAGECNITATCQGASASCHIQVRPILAESISLNTDAAMVKEGNTIQLSASVYPENTTNKAVAWVSSDETIARVNATGLVTTLAPGECDITATCPDANAICHIEVIDPADITITVETPEFAACLQNKTTLNVAISPIPTDLKAISSDTTVAVVQIEDNTVTIQGVGIGYTDIVIGSQDGISQSDTCQVSIFTHIGDANANGTTTVADVTSIIDQLLSGQPYDYLSDVNGDGRVAIDDVTILVDMLLTGGADATLIAPQSIDLDLNEVEIPVGGNYSLSATVIPEDVYNSVITWESSNRAVATVNDGVITAKGTGSCDIIAKCYNVESVCHVTVYEVKPDSVTLNHIYQRLLVGEQFTLTATVHPSNVTNPKITWSSSNSAVATVSNGKVTAVALGECDIIATCQNKRALCHIVVYQVTPDSVTLNLTNARLLVGEQLTLTATVHPSNVTNPQITWSSSNSAVATVSNGKVTAVALGECDIIATCQDKQAMCHIVVYKITPDSVALNITNAQLLVGEQLTLTATVYPSDITNPVITWSSSNRTIATVKNGKVTSVAVGECDIIATCQGVQGRCHIVVYEPTPESMTLDHENENMTVGGSLTITATVYPETITNPVITWSSSNEAVATVVDGVVTAIAVGECDIIATCQDIQAVCHIIVQEANNSGVFTVNGVSFVMVPVEGGTFKMGALNTSPDTSTSCKPQHSVTLSDYSIGQTEVTQELWVAVMGENPSLHKGNLQYPVEYVTWTKCQEFISKLNEMTGMHFRLPTEAEWEYAARGGKYSQDYKYAGSNTLAEVAWYNYNSDGQSHPVAQLKPNELNLYDMSGNVREWCQDWYAAYTSAAQTNPAGPATGSFKVYRGGSFDASYKECFVTFRYQREVSYRVGYLGLRLAL